MSDHSFKRFITEVDEGYTVLRTLRQVGRIQKIIHKTFKIMDKLDKYKMELGTDVTDIKEELRAGISSLLKASRHFIRASQMLREQHDLRIVHEIEGLETMFE